MAKTMSAEQKKAIEKRKVAVESLAAVARHYAEGRTDLYTLEMVAKAYASADRDLARYYEKEA